MSEEFPDFISIMKSFLDRPEVKDLVDKTREMVGSLEGSITEKLDHVFSKVNESIENHGGFDTLMSKVTHNILPNLIEEVVRPNVRVVLRSKEHLDYLEQHPDKALDSEGEKWSGIFAKAFGIDPEIYDARMKSLRTSLQELGQCDPTEVHVIVVRQLKEEHVDFIPKDFENVLVITESVEDLISWRVKNAQRLILQN